MERIKKLITAAAVFSSAAFIIVSCKTAQPDTLQGRELLEGDKAKSAELIKVIDDINTCSPDTINSSFSADGDSSGKKFKVEGRAVYDKRGYYYLTLTDYIFKSPVIEAYRDGDRLYFYYPAEKKLLVDDVNKINFYNYAGFKADFGFMQTMLTGGIPLLKDYSVSRLLKEDDEAYFLILENSDYFENIYFKKGVPEKILLMHKESRNKAEIYLKSLTRKDKSYFFRKIKVVAPGLGLSMNLGFSNPVLNEPVKVQSIDSLKRKKGLEVIKVN